MLFRIFAALIPLLSTIGCAAPSLVRNYEGSERKPSEVAVLYQNSESEGQIHKIDDKDVLDRVTTFNPYGWSEVHLVPGEHVLTGGLYYVGKENKHAIFRERFAFEAGKKYRLKYKVNDANTKVRFYLEQEK